MKLSIDILSILLITATPFTILVYNLLSMSNYLTPEDARQLEESWKQGIRQGEIHPDNQSYDTIISIISDRTDEEVPDGLEYLILVESAYGGAGVIADFGDKRDRKKLAPLTLTDKWINDYIKGRESNIERIFYYLALAFLIMGLILELLNRLQVF